jgi:hypothetical protein
MTNQTSLQILKHLPLAILAAITIIFGVAFSGAAQERPAFKVGDRVEVDPQARAISYKYKKWRKATVIKIGPSGGGVDSYDVKIDAEGDSGSEVVHVITDTDMDMIRPLQDAEKKDAKNDTENPAERDVKNSAADREKKVEPKKVDAKPTGISCPPSDVLGETSQSDIFKRLIRVNYLHNPEAEQDYTAYVTFQTYKVGATHQWRSGAGAGGDDTDGEGGRAGTIVYPVRVVFTVCKDHPGYAPTGNRGDIETRQDDKTYSCFKNQFGEWQCNPIESKGNVGKVVWTPKEQ